jgi:biotin-dependent carboxylase-like uncharacterized protein
MTGTLLILNAGPAVTIQDLGRPNRVAQGLSEGGAADRLAVFEAAAILGSATVLPAIEMATTGGTFQVSHPTRFALTGATMKAAIDGVQIAWNRSHILMPEQTLTIGAVQSGTYGYLTPARPIATPYWQDSQSAHLLAGIGAPLSAGDTLGLGDDPTPDRVDHAMLPSDRFKGGTVRYVAGPQSDLFSQDTQTRFQTTHFTRSAQANRQGVKLDGGAPFVPDTPKGLASDFIHLGDIQMTGEGLPYVLLTECQTIGGYPRIGTVIPADIPKIAQAPIGAALRFECITLAQADAVCPPDTAILSSLRNQARPCIRNPKDIPNLLSYQLISGMITGLDGNDTECKKQSI